MEVTAEINKLNERIKNYQSQVDSLNSTIIKVEEDKQKTIDYIREEIERINREQLNIKKEVLRRKTEYLRSQVGKYWIIKGKRPYTLVEIYKIMIGEIRYTCVKQVIPGMIELNQSIIDFNSPLVPHELFDIPCSSEKEILDIKNKIFNFI